MNMCFCVIIYTLGAIMPYFCLILPHVTLFLGWNIIAFIRLLIYMYLRYQCIISQTTHLQVSKISMHHCRTTSTITGMFEES